MNQLYFAVGVVLILVVVALLMGRRNKEGERKQISAQLGECIKLAKGDASGRRDAIIRLDTLLGKSLAYAGVNGETVGERLKNAKKLFDRKSYNNIWTAHKLRNKLVHDNYEPSGGETSSAVEYFKSSIRKLLK